LKRLVVVLIILFLSGCTQVDEEALKEEIKNELIEELAFDVEDMNDHMKEIAVQVKACTVAINVTLIDSSETFGSGIIYKQEGNVYYVLTNEHVIRYNDFVEVFIPSEDRYIMATISKEDAQMDLAILTFTSNEEYAVCEIEDVEYSEGEFVLAVGASVDIEYTNTMTLGIISRIDDERIQHDAAINIGNSGGPLFNLSGELIGLNVSKISSTSTGGFLVDVDGIGFAIKLEEILIFIA